MGNKSGKKDPRALTEEEIQLLLENTSFDRSQIIEWHNGFMKDFPSGKMNRYGFIRVYSQLYPKGRSEEYSRQVFKVFDANNSGEIDFHELMLSMQVTTLGNLKKKLEIAFQLYDIDRNGVVDKQEMTKLIHAIFELFAQDSGDTALQVNEIMAKLDVNKDGKLSHEEFVEGLTANASIRAMLVPNA